MFTNLMFTKKLALSGITMFAATLIGMPAEAQDVDVQAGETRVQVDRNGVAVDRDSTRADRQVAAERRMNQQIVDRLMIDQRSMIDLAQFGLQRTKSPEVRRLAETIVRDHQELMDKLKNVSERPVQRRGIRRGERRDVQREAARDRDEERGTLGNLADRIDEGVDRLAEGAQRAARGARDAIDRRLDDRPAARMSWISLHRDIKDRLNELAREDLQRREGHEFEASFIGMIVAAHLQEEAVLEVLSERASGDLAKMLQQELSTAKQHRAEAEQVMKAVTR